MPNSHETTLRPWLWGGALLAVLGVALCALVAWGDEVVLWRAYFLALLTVWPIVLSALGLLALGNLTGGRWAAAARPFYLAIAHTLPLLAILFVPLAFALQLLYPWATAENPQYFSPAKAAYLSPTFFLARSAGYWIVWLLIAWWIGSVSRLDLPPGTTLAMRRAGALSLVLLVPTVTFAAFDWGMSLEPHWYSSIYGAILIAGGVVAAHALALIGLALTPAATRTRMLGQLEPGGHGEESVADLYNDLGNLMLAFVMVWGYFSFSQFLIIWSANLPSEITWYETRLVHGWQGVAVAVALGCYAAPFLLLLSRDLKRYIGRLAAIATLLLAMYFLNMYWTIVPAFPVQTWIGHGASWAALLGVAGLWLALYCWRAERMVAAQTRTSDSEP